MEKSSTQLSVNHFATFYRSLVETVVQLYRREKPAMEKNVKVNNHSDTNSRPAPHVKENKKGMLKFIIISINAIITTEPLIQVLLFITMVSPRVGSRNW